MIRLLKNDDRFIHGYLNYQRKVSPNPFAPMGPNTDGENAWPVAVSEDGKRVALSFTAPGEIALPAEEKE